MTPPLPRNPWALMALELRDVARETIGRLDRQQRDAVKRLANACAAGAKLPQPERRSKSEVLFNGLASALELAVSLRRLMMLEPRDKDAVKGYRAAVALVVGLRVRLDAESRKGLDS